MEIHSTTHATAVIHTLTLTHPHPNTHTISHSHPNTHTISHSHTITHNPPPRLALSHTQKLTCEDKWFPRRSLEPFRCMHYTQRNKCFLAQRRCAGCRRAPRHPPPTAPPPKTSRTTQASSLSTNKQQANQQAKSWWKGDCHHSLCRCVVLSRLTRAVSNDGARRSLALRPVFFASCLNVRVLQWFRG